MLSSRVVLVLGWILLILLGLLCLTPLQSNDLWWHLSYGRWIWEHRMLPTYDSFSWTHAGQAMSFVPWLPALFFYGVYLIGGVAGLVWLKVVIGWNWVLGTWVYNRQRQVVWYWFLVVLVLAFFLVNSRLVLLRSMLIPFVLLPWLCVLWQISEDRQKPALRWWIPVFVWLWANSHGSWPVALIWLGLQLFWPLLWDRTRWRKELFVALLLWGGSALVTLITPTGWAAWKALTAYAGGGDRLVFQLTQEAMPLTWERLLGLRIPALVLAALSLPVMLAVSWRQYGHQFLFWLWLGWMSVQSQRYVGLFGMVAALYLPRWLQELSALAQQHRWSQWMYRSELALCFGLCLAAPVWSTWYSQTGESSLLPTEFGTSVRTHKFPEAAVQYIIRNRPKGRLYNSPFTGGYFHWRLPKHKVFADGRTVLLFSPTFFAATYGRHWLGDGRLPQTLATWNVSMALVEHGHLTDNLIQHPMWAAVAFDDYSVLFLRKNHGNDPLIQKTSYRELSLVPNLQVLLQRWKTLQHRYPQRFVQLGQELDRAVVELPYAGRHLVVARQLYRVLQKAAHKKIPR